MAQEDIQLVPYDYEHYVQSLINYLQTNLPDSYQDFLESSASRTLIDGIGFELGLLAYMVNVHAKEWFLPTAMTRKAVWLLGKLVNYDLSTAIPSGVTLKLSIDEAHTYDITIPSGTQVQVPGTTPIKFETTENGTITAGQLEVEVGASQGVTITEAIGTTTSAKSQQFNSTYSVLISTLEVWVGDVQWEEFDNLYDMGTTDRGYVTEANYEGYVTIEFGDGNFGSIPQADQSVSLKYRIGGGANTNVGTNMITEILTTLVDSVGAAVTVNVTNELAATGGADEETVEQAKINIPRSVRSLDRMVSAEDFKSLPETFSSDLYGTVYKSNAEATYTWAEHLITVYILAPDAEGLPTAPSASLIIAVKDWIQEKTLPTINIVVQSATLQTQSIVATVYYSSSYRKNIVEYNVLLAIDNLFEYSTRDLGEGMKLSEVYHALMTAEGVEWVDLTTPSADIVVGENTFLTKDPTITSTITYTKVTT